MSGVVTPVSHLIRRSGSTAHLSVDVVPTPSADLNGHQVWIVMPTYNEIENLPAIAAAVLEALPEVTLLVVDDGSPDGTGGLADRLATDDARVVVRHRVAKEGLGKAYLDGFNRAIQGGAQIVVQMDADWSHDPKALSGLIAPIVAGDADLVIGSRYTTGGQVEGWGLGRRLISRCGSVFARTVLCLAPHDLTGGFKAWRTTTLEKTASEGVHGGGYVFQIEMTHRAVSSGARVREVPIIFRDRIAGKSKMSKGIILEALFIVVRLRLEQIPSWLPTRRDR